MQNIFSLIKRKYIYYGLNIKNKIFLLLVFIIVLFILINSKSNNPYLNPLPIIKEEPECSSLFSEKTDPTIFKAAESWTIPDQETTSDFHLTQNINDCNLFLKRQNYLFNSSNSDENNFRLAYSLIVFKTASQVERLLRTIYRPWNYYCIHIDLKSTQQFFQAINLLVKCLNRKSNNIILTKNRVDVEWGEMSVLTADLKCMKELYENYKDWKYFINLTGQEFPLKTNAELVKILTAYKGANNVDGTYRKRDDIRVPTLKMQFPLIWYKGSVHITVNRDFVGFIFESPKTNDILKALENSIVPDEQFFTTLNYNAQLRIPGSFIGDPDDYLENEKSFYFLTRYKNWGKYPCISKLRVRGLCIWGVGDLPTLVRTPHLFANKFYEDFQPITLRCLEKWYYEKVKKEMLIGKCSINETYYSTLPFVKYQYQFTNE